jgi:hypothetical protein
MNITTQQARAAALQVRCPYRPCSADPGQPCINPYDRRPLEHQAAHLARLQAAGVQP